MGAAVNNRFNLHTCVYTWHLKEAAGTLRSICCSFWFPHTAQALLDRLSSSVFFDGNRTAEMVRYDSRQHRPLPSATQQHGTARHSAEQRSEEKQRRYDRFLRKAEWISDYIETSRFFKFRFLLGKTRDPRHRSSALGSTPSSSQMFLLLLHTRK